MKVLEKISDFAGKWMAIIALLVAIIAMAVPEPVHAILPTSWVNPLLGIVMFGMGMTLKLSDFKVVFTKPKAVITGILSQFIIMPLIAWVLCLVFQLPTELAVGVMLVGCCPGGTSSNVMTYLSKGDVALSVGMTACTTIMAPVVTPALVLLLAGQAVDRDRARSPFGSQGEHRPDRIVRPRRDVHAPSIPQRLDRPDDTS